MYMPGILRVLNAKRNAQEEAEQLQAILEEFVESGIPSDRRRMFRKYYNVFTGSELIQWLCQRNYVTSEDIALQV